uniref:MYND-type domain-containing protein n=1 Tax=Timema shepardi TaxID=629360 RepID=A0A7R9B4P3_TIMSH|nr:unnamed protein product [Timema shepardi]
MASSVLTDSSQLKALKTVELQHDKRVSQLRHRGEVGKKIELKHYLKLNMEESVKKCFAQMNKRCVVRLKRLSSREIEEHTRWRRRYQNQEVRFDKHSHLTASKTFKLNQDYKKRKYYTVSQIEKGKKDFETNPDSLQSEKSFPDSSPNDHHVSSDVRSRPMNVSYNSSSSDLPTGTSVSSVNLVSESSNARYCDKTPRDRKLEAAGKKYFPLRFELYSKNSGGECRLLYKQNKLSNLAEKQKFGGNKSRGSSLDGDTTKIKPTEGTDSDPLLPPHLGTVGSIRKHNQSINNLTDWDESFSSVDHTQANKNKTEKISSSPSLKTCKTSISFNNNDLKHSNLTSCDGSNPRKNDKANKIVTCCQNAERHSFVSPFQKEFAKHTMTKEATHIRTKPSVKKPYTTTDSHFTPFIYGKKNVTDRFNSVVARKRNYAPEKSDESAGHRAKRSAPDGTNTTIDSPGASATNSNNLPQNNNPIKVKQQLNDNGKGNVSEENVLSNQTPKPLSKAQNDPLNISQDKKCKKIRTKKSKSLEEKFCMLFGEDEDYVDKENTLGDNRTTVQGDTSIINVGCTPKYIDDNISETLQDEVDPLSIETSSCPPAEELEMLNSEGALDITSLGLDTLDKLFPSMAADAHNQENNINVLAGSETENTTQAAGKIQSNLQAIIMSVIDSTELGATKVIEKGADNSVSKNHAHNRNLSENGVPNKRLNENLQPKDTAIQNSHTNYNLIQTNAGKAVENTTKVIGSNLNNDGINNKWHKLAPDINVGPDKHQTQERECGTNEESSNAQQEPTKGVQQSLVESDSNGSRNLAATGPKDTDPIKIHTNAGARSNNPENTPPINTRDSENNDSTADTNGASHGKGEAAVNRGSDTAPNRSNTDRIRVRTTQFLMAKEHQLTELQLMGSPNLLWMQSLNSSDQPPPNSTAGPAPESGSSGAPSLLGPTQPITVSNYSSNETRPLNKSLETDSAGGVTAQDRPLAFTNENVDVTAILDSVKLLQLSELIYTIVLEMRRFHCRKSEAKRLSSIVAQAEASAAKSSLYDSLLNKHKYFIRLLGNHFNFFRNYNFSKYVHNTIALHFPDSNILHNEVLKCFDIIIGTHHQLIAHYMVQRGKGGSTNSSQIQGDKTMQPSVVTPQQYSAQQAYSAPVPQYNSSRANYSASWDSAPVATSSTAHGNFSDNNPGGACRNDSLPQSNNDPIINQNGALPSYENHFSIRQSLQNQQNLVPNNVNVDLPTNVFANNIYNQQAPNVNPFQNSSHQNNSQDSSSINLHSLLQQNSCFETPRCSLAPPRLNNYYHHSNDINVQQPRAGGPPNVSPLGNSNLSGSGGQLHYRAATASFQAGSSTMQENRNYQHQTPKEPPAATGVGMSLQPTKTNFTCTNTNSSATAPNTNSSAAAPSTNNVLKPPKKVGETKRKSLPKKGSAKNVPKPVGPAACPAPQMSNQPPANAGPGFINAHQAQPTHYNTSSVNNNYARDNQYLGQQTLHQNQSYQQNSFSNIASGYPRDVDLTNAAQGNVSKRSEQFDRNRYPSAAAPHADGNLGPYRQQARPNESVSLEHGSFPHSSTTQQYTAPQYPLYQPQMSPGNLRQTAEHYVAQPPVSQNMGGPQSQHISSRQYPDQQQNPSRPSVNPVAQYSATYPQSTLNSQYTSPAVNTNSHPVPVQPANIAQPGAPPLTASNTQAYVSEGSLPNQDTSDPYSKNKGVQSRMGQLLQFRKNNNLLIYHKESVQQNPQTSLGQADIPRGGGQTQYSGQKTPVVDTPQMSYQCLFEENVKSKLGSNPSIVGPLKNQKDKVACQNISQTQPKSAKIADSTLPHGTQQVATSSGNSALDSFASEPRQGKVVPFNQNTTPPKHHASTINQHNHPQNQHNPPLNHHAHTTPPNQHNPAPNGYTSPHNRHATPPNQHNPAPNGYTPHNRHTTPPNQHNPAPNQHNPAPNQHNPAPNQHNPAPNQHNPAPNGYTPHNRHATPPNQHNPAPNGYTPHNRHATPPNHHNPAPNQHNPAPNEYTPHNRHATPPNQHNPAPNQHNPAPNQHNPAPNGYTPHNRHATPPNQHNPAPNQHNPAPNQLVTLPGQYTPPLNKLSSLTYQNSSPQQIGEMPRRSSITQSRLQKLLTSPSMSALDRRLSTELPRSNDQNDVIMNDAATTDADNDSWLIKLKEPTNCLLCDRQAAEACSSCRKAFYCSKACQVKHWEESHYAECVPEQVSNNSD